MSLFRLFNWVMCGFKSDEFKLRLVHSRDARYYIQYWHNYEWNSIQVWSHPNEHKTDPLTFWCRYTGSMPSIENDAKTKFNTLDKIKDHHKRESERRDNWLAANNEWYDRKIAFTVKEVQID